VATARRPDLVERTAAEIEASGRRTLRLTTDVTNRESLVRVRDACLATLGRIDILVCAAGITKRVPTLSMDDADWQRILETNLTGTLYACQVFGAPMVAARSGRVINVASLSSFLGFF